MIIPKLVCNSIPKAIASDSPCPKRSFRRLAKEIKLTFLTIKRRFFRIISVALFPRVPEER